MEDEAELVHLDRVDRVVEVDGMVAVFTAERYVVIDRLRVAAMSDAAQYGAGLAGVAERSVRLELAAALRITEHAAERLMVRADALVHRYPAALTSLGAARISEQHAAVLVDLLDPLDPVLREALTARAVTLAETQPVGVFRRKLRDLIETDRHTTLTERHTVALRQRHVRVETVDDGMAWLTAYLPAVEAHAIHGRVTAIAKTLGGDNDDRSLDERRADALCDLLIDGDTTTHPDSARGIRPTVVVTVPALALLGTGEDSVPATVEGIGPIPIERARELCGSADGWMRVLTHPETGMVLSVGRRQYQPPKSLRKLAAWRADRCMAPGCGIPAWRCQIDHSIAWEHGGTTALTNLAPLCTGHHTIKHHGRWALTQMDNGTIEWTSPTGRKYLVEPERRTPTFHPNNEPAPF
ncbi:DUF222 domain-containing protein [Microbacterium sp. NPDC055357]